MVCSRALVCKYVYAGEAGDVPLPLSKARRAVVATFVLAVGLIQ